VVLLSISLGSLVNSYSESREERNRLLRTRAAALTAIQAETRANRGISRRNAERVRESIGKRGSYPSFEFYNLNAWMSVSGSEGLTTLEPQTFANIALFYGDLSNANRLYAMWEANYVYSVPSPISSESEWTLREQVRTNVLSILSSSAEVAERNLATLGGVLDIELRQVRLDRIFTYAELAPLRFVQIGIALIGLVALVFLLRTALAEWAEGRGRLGRSSASTTTGTEAPQTEESASLAGPIPKSEES